MKENLDDLMREQKLKYYKKWREKNKEKIKQYNQKFWLKKMKEENKNV